MTMTAQEAAGFLNEDVAWEPGLIVRADAEPYAPGGGFIYVTLRRLSVDSSRVNPDGTYPPCLAENLTEVTMRVTLDPLQYRTRETALYHVLRQIGELHLHDSREFTRVRDPDGPSGWGAPFHPHRPAGNLLWAGSGRVLPAVRTADPGSRSRGEVKDDRPQCGQEKEKEDAES